VKVLIFIYLLGFPLGEGKGRFTKNRIAHEIGEVEIRPGGLLPISEGYFEFHPFNRHPARKFLKIISKIKTLEIKNPVLKSVSRKDKGDMIMKKGKIFIPDKAMSTFSEVVFWKKIHPEIEGIKDRLKKLHKNYKNKDKEFHKQVMRLKNEFHRNFLQKRIKVMKVLGNQKALMEAQEAERKLELYLKKEKTK